jgi:hypothetical protein
MEVFVSNNNTIYCVIIYEGSTGRSLFYSFFSFSPPTGTSKCVLPNSINRVGKNVLGPKI